MGRAGGGGGGQTEASLQSLLDARLNPTHYAFRAMDWLVVSTLGSPGEYPPAPVHQLPSLPR